MILEVNGQDLIDYVEGVVTTGSLDGEKKAPALFVPHELKTIEVDIEKKIFKVNGEEFGHGCTGFSISCDGCDDFKVRMEIETRVVLGSYEGIHRVSTEEYTVHGLRRGESSDQGE